MPFASGDNIECASENTTQETRFCIRLPRDPSWHTGQQLKQEAALRRRIDVERLPLFRRLIAHDITSGNPPGTPCSALSLADGVSLKWTDSTPAEMSHRENSQCHGSSRYGSTQDSHARRLFNLHILGAFCPDIEIFLGCTAREFIAKEIDARSLGLEQTRSAAGRSRRARAKKALVPKYFLSDKPPHALACGNHSVDDIAVDQSWDVPG